MRGRAPSREPARPLKLPQPGPLLNIVGRTSDWFVLEGSEAKRIFCAYGTVIYETTCRSDVRPTIFKRALEGGCKGKPGLRNSDGFPLAVLS